MIHADHVHFAVGDRKLVDDVSLEARPGEVLVLAGPNGAGKSTLLRCLVGLYRPTSGEVRLDGQAVTNWGRLAFARACAVLLQDDGLSAPLLVREVVGLGRHPHGDVDRYDVGAVLREVGLPGLADRRIGTLSGGERQRVHLARVLAQLDGPEARALILDEPTSALDLAQQHLVLDRVARVTRERGIAAIVVVHDLNLAARFADRLALLVGGRLVACGPVAEVVTPDRLRDVYRVEVHVLPHPDDGGPQVLVARC